MPQHHKVYLVDAALMARTCRKLAADLRREHGRGWGPVPMSAPDNRDRWGMPRDQAAQSMDEQAERWEDEVRTGIPNYHDREKIGE